MRISGISSYNNYNNYNNNNRNVAFGKFRDENARAELRKVFTPKPEAREYLQSKYDSRYQLIDECTYADVFTVSDGSGRIQVEYDDKYINSKSNGKNLDSMMPFYDDLRNYYDASELSDYISLINMALLPGEEEEPVDDGPGPIARAQERLEQERIDRLNF